MKNEAQNNLIKSLNTSGSIILKGPQIQAAFPQPDKITAIKQFATTQNSNFCMIGNILEITKTQQPG